MCIGCALERYIWLSNKVSCNIHIGDTLNYLNSRCNTAKLLWVVIYVVCYGCFSPDLVVMNICRQRLIKVDRPLWQRSLANENAVVCRQGAMCWRLIPFVTYDLTSLLTLKLHNESKSLKWMRKKQQKQINHPLTAVRVMPCFDHYLLWISTCMYSFNSAKFMVTSTKEL